MLDQQKSYLSEFGGPIIKHLMGGSSLSKELLCEYLERLPKKLAVETICGSGDTFENVIGKLILLGAEVGDVFTLEERHNCYHYINEEENDLIIYHHLSKYIVAGYLYCLGDQSKVVKDYVYQRINALHKSVLKGFDSIYSMKNGVPVRYNSKKVIDPTYYKNRSFDLPLMYDMFVFSYVYNELSSDYKEKIDVILTFIGQDDYQNLDYGYGLVAHNKSFHSMGWSVHLYGLNSLITGDYFEKGLLFRLYILSKFNHRLINTWIDKGIHDLRGYRVDDFRYCFPSKILQAQRKSYFMNGRDLGLHENRRLKQGKTIESTYYMYCIMKNREDD